MARLGITRHPLHHRLPEPANPVTPSRCDSFRRLQACRAPCARCEAPSRLRCNGKQDIEFRRLLAYTSENCSVGEMFNVFSGEGSLLPAEVARRRRQPLGRVSAQARGLDASADLDEVDGVVGEHRPVLPAVEDLLDVGPLHAGPSDRHFVVVVRAGGVGDDRDKLAGAVEGAGGAGGGVVAPEPKLARAPVGVEEVVGEPVVDVGHGCHCLPRRVGPGAAVSAGTSPAPVPGVADASRVFTTVDRRVGGRSKAPIIN